MKHLKLLKKNELYDSWIKSDNAGFPNVVSLDFSNENYGQSGVIIFTENDPTPPLPPAPPPPVCPIPEEGLEIYETYNCPPDLLEVNTQNGIALFNYFASLCPNDGDTYTLNDNEFLVATYDSNPSPVTTNMTTEKITEVSRTIIEITNPYETRIDDFIVCEHEPYLYESPGGPSGNTKIWIANNGSITYSNS